MHEIILEISIFSVLCCAPILHVQGPFSPAQGSSRSGQGPFDLQVTFELSRTLWSVKGPYSLFRGPSKLARDCTGCFFSMPTCSGASDLPRGLSVLA